MTATTQGEEKTASLVQEWDEMEAKVKDRGFLSADKKRMQELAKALDREVPKWANGGGKAKAQPRRETDAELILAHKMTALVTKGSVEKDGSVKVGEQSFGAAYNTTQVREISEAFKSKDILKTLGGVSEADLKRYAQGDKPELSAEVKTAFREFVKQFDPKRKLWARKVAGAAYVLLQERKAAKRKS